jgi:hypothetical protein
MIFGRVPGHRQVYVSSTLRDHIGVTRKQPPRTPFVLPDVREAALDRVPGHEASAWRVADWLHRLQPHDDDAGPSQHEFTLDLERPWRHLLITLPTAWLDSRVARPELLPRAVLRDHPLARLWASHVATGFALAGELSSAAATLFARHSVDLLAQLLDESPRDHLTASDAWRAAMFLSACEVIALITYCRS